MASPTMKLAKGGGAAAAAKAAAAGKAPKQTKPAKQSVPGPDAVDKMTAAQLAQVVAKFGLDVDTDAFKVMKVAEKRAAVKDALEKKGADGEAKPGTALAKHVTQEVADADDPIVSFQAGLDEYDESTAREAVQEMTEDLDYNYFRIGGMLCLIHEQGWHEGYDTFAEYVEGELMSRRVAYHLMSIYRGITQLNLPWKKVAPIGWTKLHRALPYMNEENADDILAIAAKAPRSKMKDEIAGYLGEGGDGAGKGKADKTTSKVFRLHDDQAAAVEAAIKQAKEVSGTEHDSVALQHIATQFLNDPQAGGSINVPVGKKKALTQFFTDLFTLIHDKGKKDGTDDLLIALEVIENIWPGSEVSIEFSS